MADLTIGTVVANSVTTTLRGYTYGDTIAAGDVVYLDSSNNKVKPAECDGTQSQARAIGIAYEAGVDNDTKFICTSGYIDVGAALSIGDSYVVSANAGKIAAVADLGSGHYVTHLGYAVSTDEINLRPYAEGVQA